LDVAVGLDSLLGPVHVTFALMVSVCSSFGSELVGFAIKSLRNSIGKGGKMHSYILGHLGALKAAGRLDRLQEGDKIRAFPTGERNVCVRQPAQGIAMESAELRCMRRRRRKVE